MALAIILTSLLKWKYMWEGEFLGKWVSIATIISLGMSLYFWKKRQDSTDERTRASKNVHTELDDALDGLDEKKHAGDLEQSRYLKQQKPTL